MVSLQYVHDDAFLTQAPKEMFLGINRIELVVLQYASARVSIIVDS